MFSLLLHGQKNKFYLVFQCTESQGFVYSLSVSEKVNLKTNKGFKRFDSQNRFAQIVHLSIDLITKINQKIRFAQIVHLSIDLITKDKPKDQNKIY